jgi:hypothetical protein
MSCGLIPALREIEAASPFMNSTARSGSFKVEAEIRG